MPIDLHVHSNVSDGTYTPEELVNYAVEKNLDFFALTDHDTVAGIERASAEALRLSTNSKKITVIPGVELSTAYNKKDIHILGLFVDYKDKSFIERLCRFNTLRNERNKKMCDLLKNEGIEISMSKMQEKFGETVITRAHFARYLLDNGYVSSINEAFKSYLNAGCPCYVPKVKCTPFEAIDIIKKAKGFPILAHPLIYNMTDEALEVLIAKLKDSGLMGIEAIYSLNTGSDEEKLISLAKKYKLFITGGSDFHGNNKPSIDLGTGKGNLNIPLSLLEQFSVI